MTPSVEGQTSSRTLRYSLEEAAVKVFLPRYY